MKLIALTLPKGARLGNALADDDDDDNDDENGGSHETIAVGLMAMPMMAAITMPISMLMMRTVTLMMAPMASMRAFQETLVWEAQ